MRLMSLALILASLTAGCATNQKSDPAAEAPPVVKLDNQRIDAIRSGIQSIDPRARAGRVIAVVEDQRLAAIGDLDVAGLQHGSQITFVNADQKVIAFGEIERVVGDAIHVRYRADGAAQRAPAVGDVGIWFSR